MIVYEQTNRLLDYFQFHQKLLVTVTYDNWYIVSLLIVWDGNTYLWSRNDLDLFIVAHSLCDVHISNKVHWIILCWCFRGDYTESASEDLKANTWNKTIPQNNAKLHHNLALPAQLPSGADLPSCTGRILYLQQITLCSASYKKYVNEVWLTLCCLPILFTTMPQPRFNQIGVL